MNRTKLCAAGLILALLCQLFTAGCSENKILLYFEFQQSPTTVDPQTASTAEERLLAANLFEGLLRQDDAGNLVCAAAEDYSVQGLTYTFTLRRDVHWDNGDTVTADDFVFGISRAMDAATACPTANRLAALQSITAPDDRTVVCTLSRADDTFLQALTTPACMPCNRAFFENCVGKYGLGQKYIRCNGSYYLARWNREDFGMRIYKNAEYTGTFQAHNGGVFFSCDTTEKSVLQKLYDNEIDMTALPQSQLTQAVERGFATAECQNICWVLRMSDDFRSRYGAALQATLYSESLSQGLPTGFSSADSFCPAAVGFEGTLSLPEYNLTAAKAAFAAAVNSESEKKFPQTVLYYADCEGGKDLGLILAGHWQQALSAFINIEAAENGTLQAAEAVPDLSLFCVTATDADAEYYLDTFAAGTGDAAARQQRLLAEGLYPVAFQKTAVAYSTALSGVTLRFDGCIDFSGIDKTG